MPQYDENLQKAMDSLMEGVSGAEQGKMFGYPGYKVNGKLAVGMHEQGVIVKIGRDRASKLIEDGVGSQFIPQTGRVWRDWVLLTGDISGHKGLFEEAVKYVTAETSS